MMPLSIPNNIDKYFYNRKYDIKRISFFIDGIYEDLPSQLLIAGRRGVGKTFLLKKILHDQKKDICTIYIDISKIYSTYGGELTEAAVLKTLLDSYKDILNKDDNLVDKGFSIFNDLKLKGYDFNSNSHILNIPIPKIKDNYSKLSKFVMELPQKIVDSRRDIKGFVIVIDEFQLLKYVNDPDSFFWLFRSYIQNQKNVCYIFTGSVSKTADVIEMINGQSGAFGGRMIQIDIEPFTKEETLNYINDKAKGIKFSEGGFDRFYKCTKGIPAFINSFCNVLSENVEYDENMIKEKFLFQMDQIVLLWIYVWGNLNDYEKEIVKIIVEDDGLNLEEFKKRTGFSKNTLLKYFDSLSIKGIVNYYNGKYYIADDMLKAWLLNKKNTEGHFPF